MRFEDIFEADYVTEKTIELIRANDVRETLHLVPTVFVNGRGGPETRGPVALSHHRQSRVYPRIRRDRVQRGR